MIITELVIGRHGQAACNTGGVVGGERGCTGLTALGGRQTGQLADRLRNEHRERPFNAFYTTPRLRVRQSAEIVAEALGLRPAIEPDLRGPDHGDADGQPWSDVKTAFGSALQHQPDRPVAAGAETWNAYLTRATMTLEKLLTRHDGQRILIIGHGETIEAAHTLLLKLPGQSSAGFWFTSGHAAISRWQRQTSSNGRITWLLDAHNDRCHLAEATR